MVKFLYTVFLSILLSLPLQAQNLAFIDIHNSSLFRLLRENKLDGLHDEEAIVNIKQLRENQTKFMVLSVGIPFLSSGDLEDLTIEDVLALYRAFTHHYEKDLQLSTNRKLCKTAQKEKKIPFCFALEGTHLLNDNINWLDSLYAVGVRFITLGHWFQNHFIVSPDDPHYQNKTPIFLNEKSVLSTKGKALIRKMAALGIVLDISHLPEHLITDIDALQIPHLQLIASHSNAHSIYTHDRNLSDSIIKKLSKRKALIGICFHQNMIGRNAEENFQKLLLHIKHMLQTGGHKSITIGSDYEGGIKTPKELNKLNGLRQLNQALQEVGLSPKVIRHLYWKNAWRFIKKQVLK